jgi:cytidine deaminase
MAKKARESAIAGNSGFKVGAALLTACGKVFSGCNIEDPSGVGVTNICAERCAAVKALSEGYTDFVKIAVAGGADELVFCTPCGVCRQYLNSFSPKIKIVCLRGDAIVEYALSELLPFSFDSP